MLQDPVLLYLFLMQSAGLFALRECCRKLAIRSHQRSRYNVQGENDLA